MALAPLKPLPLFLVLQSSPTAVFSSSSPSVPQFLPVSILEDTISTIRLVNCPVIFKGREYLRLFIPAAWHGTWPPLWIQ